MYRRPGFNCVVCELRFFSELTITDYAGVANTQHAQIAIFKFAIYLGKSETQLFYYAIKTRPTRYMQGQENMYGVIKFWGPHEIGDPGSLIYR